MAEDTKALLFEAVQDGRLDTRKGGQNSLQAGARSLVADPARGHEAKIRLTVLPLRVIRNV